MNSLFHVNGKPFFSVGGQLNNSTSFSIEKTKRAFAGAARLGLNTVAAPVYWEALEQSEGAYSFQLVDRLIDTAREYGLHLIILWFGTWKNGNSHYIPRWMKLDGKRFPMAKGPDGIPVCSLSPHFEATNQADRAAFAALCSRIAEKNTDETVIGVQVENEPGFIGTARDNSLEANVLFCAEVPREVAKYAGKTGTWSQVFGYHAAEFFSAWSISRYIDRVVVEGKKKLDIPMYTNVWLGEMHNRIAGVDYPSGGAVIRTLELFRLGAPHLDTISPDIYLQDQDTWTAVNNAYQDGVHPYYLPELLPGVLPVTRAIQSVVENNLCGVHFFAIDLMTLGEDGAVPPPYLEAVQGLQTLLEMKPLIEKNQGTGKLYAVAQYEGMSEKYIDFDDYIGSIRFSSANGDAMAKSVPLGKDIDHFFFSDKEQRGKGVICYEGNGKFYLSGNSYRLMLFPKGNIEQSTSASHSGDFLNTRTQPYLSVTEGHFDAEGNYQAVCRRSGDEMDNGIWVTSDVGVVCIEMNTGFYD